VCLPKFDCSANLLDRSVQAVRHAIKGGELFQPHAADLTKEFVRHAQRQQIPISSNLSIAEALPFGLPRAIYVHSPVAGISSLAAESAQPGDRQQWQRGNNANIKTFRQLRAEMNSEVQHVDRELNRVLRQQTVKESNSEGRLWRATPTRDLENREA
jgi:hypothetical protein